MKYSGRNLTYNLSGKDVAALHRALRRLGYELPAGETSAIRFGDETLKAVMAVQRDAGLEPDGVVERRTVYALNRLLAAAIQVGEGQYYVRGTVRNPDGSAFVGQVIVHDRDLRKAEPLGRVEIGRSGYFELAYSPQKFLRAERGAADIAFELHDGGGKTIETFQLEQRIQEAWEPIGHPQVIFQADDEVQVRIVIGSQAYRGPSEYEQLVSDLELLLQGISFAELAEDDEHQDITFLSGETGQDPERIAFLIVAHRYFEETRLPAEIFYGMFRQGLPANLPALLAQSQDVKRRALVRSAQDNLIRPAYADEADAIMERFKRLVVDQAMKPPAVEGRAPCKGRVQISSLSRSNPAVAWPESLAVGSLSGSLTQRGNRAGFKIHEQRSRSRPTASVDTGDAI